MKKFIYIFLIALTYLNCGNGGNILNGEYCAEVNYVNSKTKTSSDYLLIVEIENNQLSKINFPKGWLDKDDFNVVIFNSSKKAKFKIEENKIYSLSIIGESEHCFDGVKEPTRCKGITKSGKRCKKLTDNKNGFCWQHRNQK